MDKRRVRHGREFRSGKFDTDSKGGDGVFIDGFPAPFNDRAVILWSGFKGLGIELDIYSRSRFEGNL